MSAYQIRYIRHDNRFSYNSYSKTKGPQIIINFESTNIVQFIKSSATAQKFTKVLFNYFSAVQPHFKLPLANTHLRAYGCLWFYHTSLWWCAIAGSRPNVKGYTTQLTFAWLIFVVDLTLFFLHFCILLRISLYFSYLLLLLLLYKPVFFFCIFQLLGERLCCTFVSRLAFVARFSFHSMFLCFC